MGQARGAHQEAAGEQAELLVLVPVRRRRAGGRDQLDDVAAGPRLAQQVGDVPGVRAVSTIRVSQGKVAGSEVQVLGATTRVAYHRLIITLMAVMLISRDCRYRLQYGVKAPSAA